MHEHVCVRDAAAVVSGKRPYQSGLQDGAWPPPCLQDGAWPPPLPLPPPPPPPPPLQLPRRIVSRGPATAHLLEPHRLRRLEQRRWQLEWQQGQQGSQGPQGPQTPSSIGSSSVSATCATVTDATRGWQYGDQSERVCRFVRMDVVVDCVCLMWKRSPPGVCRNLGRGRRVGGVHRSIEDISMGGVDCGCGGCLCGCCIPDDSLAEGDWVVVDGVRRIRQPGFEGRRRVPASS